MLSHGDKTMKELTFKLTIIQDDSKMYEDNPIPEDIKDYILECLDDNGFEGNVYLELLYDKEILEN